MKVWSCVFTLTNCALAVSARYQFFCNCSRSCEDAHFDNPQLQTIFDQRCVHKDFFTSSTNNITYTHIPKVGGSSLNQVLRRLFPARFERTLHEPFHLSALKGPSNLFVTALREPRDRAISLYSYINQREKLPNTTANNEMWHRTFRADPSVWSTDAGVLKRLRGDVLTYFNVNSTAHATMLPPSPIGVCKERFLQYAENIPPEFRCKRYMEVAWILLRNYAVVGVTENLPRLFKLLQKRTKTADPAFLRNATSVYRNRSNYRRVGAANVTILYNNLRDKFFCDAVLWKIADMMNARDLLC
jgi:hypothetical protein